MAFSAPEGTTARIRFSIGTKLAVIIGSLVLVSLVTVTLLNSYFISQDVRITAEDNNLTINSRAASTVQNELESLKESALQLFDSIEIPGADGLSKRYFERNPHIAEIIVFTRRETADGVELVPVRDLRSERFFTSLSSTQTDAFLSAHKNLISRACAGEALAANPSPFFGRDMLAFFIPYQKSAQHYCCLVLSSLETVADILGRGGANTTCLIDGAGAILCHPDNDRVLRGETLESHPLVVYLNTANPQPGVSQQQPFSLPQERGGEALYLGAFQKLSVADIAVLTTVPLDLVLEGVRTTWRNNLYLTACVLFITILLVLTFSRYGISRHLRLLTACANDIQQGNFNSDLIPLLNVRRGDEIGILNRSTRDEQDFLNTFARFTNRAVAKAIARKEIDFEPHLKDVTVFFSDIRGFTKISDDYKTRFGDDSPRAIIGFLNDYMSRMVNCVTISGGTIDKFEGDAIMAVWGILRDESLDFEQLPPGAEKQALEAAHRKRMQEDAFNAIRGTIAMRYALMQYNKDAAVFNKAHEGEKNAPYKPHIQIGCGINTGRATCGIMGSEDKMEYTAIGDSVNFASRTESSNKPCGTDILISEDTWNLLKDDYADELIVEKIPVAFEVKGKGTQHFYAVVNLPKFDIVAFFRATDPCFEPDSDAACCAGPTGPKNLQELRALLGIPTPDYESLDLHEENKVQIAK